MEKGVTKLRLTGGLAKLGLDKLSFNILSLSSLVPGGHNITGQLYATSNFNYKSASVPGGQLENPQLR